MTRLSKLASSSSLLALMHSPFQFSIFLRKKDGERERGGKAWDKAMTEMHWTFLFGWWLHSNQKSLFNSFVSLRDDPFVFFLLALWSGEEK